MNDICRQFYIVKVKCWNDNLALLLLIYKQFKKLNLRENQPGLGLYRAKKARLFSCLKVYDHVLISHEQHWAKFWIKHWITVPFQIIWKLIEIKLRAGLGQGTIFFWPAFLCLQGNTVEPNRA